MKKILYSIYVRSIKVISCLNLNHFINRFFLKKCGEKVFFASGVKIKNHFLISIDSFTQIAENCYISGGGEIKIGKYCQIANNTIIVSGNHLIGSMYMNNSEYKDVTIGNNVWIGSGAIILGGITIGDNSIIGAGAVVNKDIPEDSIAVGVPAKVIKKIDFKK